MALDKLVDSTQLDADLTSIANAIRTKGGTSSSLTFPSDFVSAINAIDAGGGGGITPAPERDVNFIDYDGTIVYSYSKTDFLALSALPANPSHAGLTAQGWNWSLTDAKTYVTSYGKLWIGQMYITTSGDTEIDVVMQNGRLSPYLVLAVDGTVTVDWGDNTALDTVTGSSLSSRKAVSHTYSDAGNYTISIHVSSGSFGFYGSMDGQYTILRDSSASVVKNYVYANCIKAVRIGNIDSFSYGAFYYCRSLESITIPNSVSSIYGAFMSCYSLKSVTIPSSVTNISSAFSSCNGLSYVSIPRSVTIVNDAFSGCYSLSSVSIPDLITEVGSSYGAGAFSYCTGLATVTIPSSVTMINSSTFSGDYGVAEYHIMPTSPPQLANTNAFMYIQSDCVMYVPYSADHSILNAYKTATNWSTYSSYMQEEPQ